MVKKMYVTLEIKKNPPVRLDPVVRGKAKMEWLQDEESVDFVFKDITGLPNSFQKKVKNKKIEVTDDMVPGDHEYTITVEHNGVTYSTTPSKLSEADGKPVIRN